MEHFAIPITRMQLHALVRHSGEHYQRAQTNHVPIGLRHAATSKHGSILDAPRTQRKPQYSFLLIWTLLPKAIKLTNTFSSSLIELLNTAWHGSRIINDTYERISYLDRSPRNVHLSYVQKAERPKSVSTA